MGHRPTFRRSPRGISIVVPTTNASSPVLTIEIGVPFDADLALRAVAVGSRIRSQEGSTRDRRHVARCDCTSGHVEHQRCGSGIRA